MNYLLPVLITAVVASQAMIWHSLGTIRDAIQQTNAIIMAACGSDERPCQVAAHRGQIELGEMMVRTRTDDGFSCGYSRFNPCWIKASGEDAGMERHAGGLPLVSNFARDAIILDRQPLARNASRMRPSFAFLFHGA